MNLSEMLDKGEENKSFHELLDLPISSLQGIAERADEMMEGSVCVKGWVGAWEELNGTEGMVVDE